MEKINYARFSKQLFSKLKRGHYGLVRGLQLEKAGETERNNQNSKFNSNWRIDGVWEGLAAWKRLLWDFWWKRQLGHITAVGLRGDKEHTFITTVSHCRAPWWDCHFCCCYHDATRLSPTQTLLCTTRQTKITLTFRNLLSVPCSSFTLTSVLVLAALTEIP